MTFANPAGLLLLGLVVPVLLLHVLKPQRDSVDVSSVYLWKGLAAPVSAARPWQRLRPSLLLLLQLLVVVGLALAVARPVRLTQSLVAEHTVFIIDASGSMAARDGDPDRLADALDEARRLRSELPDGGLASVVVAAARPDVLLTASTDRQAFDDALDEIGTTPGGADFADAFSLAEGLETPGAEVGFVLVSDGGLTDAEQRLMPPASVYRMVGDESANRAITRLTVEPRGTGLFAVVALRNSGEDEATQTLRVDVDGRTRFEDEVTLEGRGAQEVTIPDLPAGDRIEAFLEGEDLLDADDHAYAVAARPASIDVTVVVPEAVPDEDVEGADPILDALLQSMEGVEATWVKAGQETGPGAPAPTAPDLIIYDQSPVPAVPPAPFWAIAPPGGAPGVTVTGEVEAPVLTSLHPDDPLVVDLDLSEVTFAAAQQLDAPAAEVLAGSEGTPLVLRALFGEESFVYQGFPFQHSTIWKQEAFPVLGSRIVTELAGAALPPGSAEVGATLPVPRDRDSRVIAPGGAVTEVPAGAPVPRATRVGFWTIETAGQPARALAVNAAPGESDIKPAPSLLAEERAVAEGDSLPRGQRSVLAWLVPPLLAIVLAEWLLMRRRAGVGRGQFRVATGLRLLVVLALVGALLNLAWARPANRVATMFLIDASDSLGPTGEEEALDWVRQAIGDMPDDSLAGVALIGAKARLELTMQADPVLGPATVQLDASRTNLADALRLAKAVLPADARRRVVMVSDGRPTEGDVEEEARELRDEGIPVDVHLVERSGGPDVAVAGLDVPNQVRQGEQVPITATVIADRAGPAVVTLLSGGEELATRNVDLVEGENQVGFTVPAGQPGIARYQVRVATASDTVRENDVGYGAVHVQGPAKVLVLEGHDGAGGAIVEALRASGMTLDVKPVAEMPPLDVLGTEYRSVVLADVSADQVTAEQVETLTAATRDMGRGLVTVGGTQSYGPGGYLGSDLEKLLPVVSDILDPKRRQTVSQVLAVDTSGSMDACHCSEGGQMSDRNRGGIKKTDIARSGAARAIEALSSTDHVGILGIDTEERWLMDLQQLPAEDVVTSGLRKITPTGSSTDLSAALSTAAEALRTSRTNLKHIILFTDGFVADPGIFDDMEEEAAALREEGITVSVLATGEGAAKELEAIAVAGGGRFYAGLDLQEIPQLMQEETVIASRSFITEGEFVPTITSAAATVRDLAATPPLLGYVATTSKDQASTDLRIGPDQDPLLASWNVGLGKVTSWTSDAGQRWGQTWTDWAGFVDFWSGVVGSTFPPDSNSQVTAHVEDGKLVIRLEGEPGTEFPQGAEATAKITDPVLGVQDVRLERVGPNSFSAEVPVTSAGTYGVAATVSGGSGSGSGSSGASGQVLGGTALASLSYGPEYEPGEADPALLRRVSELTTGRGEIQVTQAFDRDGSNAGTKRFPVGRWLLVLAALMWPLAVALSRLALRGAVAGRVRYTGASVGWYLRVFRSRLPELPGRSGRAPADVSPSPSLLDADAATGDGSSGRRSKAGRRSAGSRPERPAAAGKAKKDEVAAPAATLGSLLASQRRRRDGDPDPDGS